MTPTKTLTILSSCLALGVLAGCMEDTSNVDVALREGAKADEDACLAAVAKTTNNTVTVLSSEMSQANTTVMVGVGPQKAPWRCLVSGGRVAEVMSTVNEGTL